jgi:uncharacterized protein YlxW (UPF0749 family)
MDPEALKLFWILTAIGLSGGVVYTVVAVVNLVTRKLEGRPAADPEELEELRARAEQVEYLEQRVAELETRVDFAERLLTAPTREPTETPTDPGEPR